MSVPYTLANGPGNPPDATKLMANFNYFADVITVSATGVGISRKLEAKGTDTNDNVAAGYQGEFSEATVTSPTNFPTTATWGDATSLSLTGGDWEVSIIVVAQANGSTCTQWSCGLGTASGTGTGGLTVGTTQAVNAGTLGAYSTLIVPPSRVSIASTSTRYLKVSATYSAGTPQYTARISARRVR